MAEDVEKRKLRRKRYYEKHRAESLEYQKEYYKKNKEAVNAMVMKWHKEHPKQVSIAQIRFHLKRRGVLAAQIEAIIKAL
jgi:hypothetical protein